MEETKTFIPFIFRGFNFDICRDGDTDWVSVRRVCETLGISFQSQHRKLTSTAWARTKTILINDTMNRKQKAFVVDLHSFPMWLATISPGKVDEKNRPKLLAFQKEIKKVLSGSKKEAMAVFAG